MFDRNRPYNDLLPLSPAPEVETAPVLKKAIAASRALAARSADALSVAACY